MKNGTSRDQRIMSFRETNIRASSDPNHFALGHKDVT
jgi:hypothetical protein